MTAYVCLIVALLGALVYLPSPTAPAAWWGKLQELGRLAFACGLLAWLLTVAAGKAVHLP